MKPLLLAANVSPFGSFAEGGAVSPDCAPRWDVAEIARILGAEISCPPPKSGAVVGALEDKTASDLRQAWAAWRRRGETSVVVSLSEKAGVPLALLSGRKGQGGPPHVLIAHHLTSPKKRALQTRTQYLAAFDRIIVLCQAQARYLIDEAKIAPDRVRCIYDKVDHRFWTPEPDRAGDEAHDGDDGLIVAVGRERRDYATLLEAVRPLTNRRVVVVASSPWAREKGEGTGRKTNVPAHVEVKSGLSWTELRDLYRRASVVVVPLQTGTDYAAGVNAVLEAMAMRKPLVVTLTPGIADYVRDRETCLTVPPSDPAALRAALTELTERALADRLAENARAVIENGRNLHAYVEAVRAVVCEVAPC